MARTPNQREITPDDLKPGRRPDIDTSTADGLLNRPEEEILLVDKPLGHDEAAALAFAEEEVLIRLERNGDKFQAALVPFSVNGKTQWVPVNQPFKVKRKFLEVIIRAQPNAVTTEHDNATVDRPRNILHRSQFPRHPVSILRDPNPAGAEWAMRISAES